MRRAPLVITMLLAAAPLAAQDAPVGSATFRFTTKPSAAMTAQLPITEIPAFRVTVAGDGKRFAVSLALEDTSSAGPGGFLAGAWLRLVIPQAGDSIDFALALPPMLAAMVAEGGEPPSGLRGRVAIPNVDSLAATMPGLNVVTAEQPETRPLGTKRTVAGIACEDWEMKQATTVMHVCVAEHQELLLGMEKWAKTRMGAQKAPPPPNGVLPFNGRPVVPVRMAADDGSFLMELVASTRTAPASAFAIPADFKTFDPATVAPMLPKRSSW